MSTIPQTETRCEKCNRILTDRESVREGLGPCCRIGEPYITPYTIIIDTREQAPFRFTGLETRPSKGSRPIYPTTVVRGLPAGDYSIEGMEDRIALERKSKEDLYGTLGRGRERFCRELERLNLMRFAAVVVECDWLELEQLPPVHSKVPPAAICGSILAMMQDFPGVHWLLCMNRRHAEEMTFRLLHRFWEKNRNVE